MLIFLFNIQNVFKHPPPSIIMLGVGFTTFCKVGPRVPEGWKDLCETWTDDMFCEYRVNKYWFQSWESLVLRHIGEKLGRFQNGNIIQLGVFQLSWWNFTLWKDRYKGGGEETHSIMGAGSCDGVVRWATSLGGRIAVSRLQKAQSAFGLDFIL